MKALKLLFLILLAILVSACSGVYKEVEEQIESGIAEQQPLYPHDTTFKNPEVHGELFKRDRTKCTACHGEDLTGNFTKVSCFSCHEGFPHKENFKHGTAYQENPEICASCHQKKETWTSCNSCHADFPHSAQFIDEGDHAQKFFSNKDSCTRCHGEDLEINEEGKNLCSTCHQGYPHTENFKTTFSHGTEYFAGDKSCNNCHKEEQPNIKNCKECHDFPHKVGWLDPRIHGQTFLAETTEDNFRCVNCHSVRSEFKTRNPNEFKSCEKCHEYEDNIELVIHRSGNTTIKDCILCHSRYF